MTGSLGLPARGGWGFLLKATCELAEVSICKGSEEPNNQAFLKHLLPTRYLIAGSDQNKAQNEPKSAAENL